MYICDTPKFINKLIQIKKLVMKFNDLSKKTKNKEYEQRLKNEFGLFRQGENWAYNGDGALDVESQQLLNNNKTCMEMIEHLRTVFEIDLMCLVPGKPTILAFNAEPPYALASSIQPYEAAELIDSIIKKTKLKIVEYKDTFMVSLP